MKLVNGSLAALVAVALSGCVNIGVPLQEHAGALDQSQSAKQSLAAVQSCCASLAELKFQPLLEGSSVLTIDGASQAFRFEEGMSYLGAYRLPENTGDLIIKVAAQVGKSVLIDHFGWFGTARKRVNGERWIALLLIVVALVLIARG